MVLLHVELDHDRVSIAVADSGLSGPRRSGLPVTPNVHPRMMPCMIRSSAWRTHGGNIGRSA